MSMILVKMVKIYIADYKYLYCTIMLHSVMQQ